VDNVDSFFFLEGWVNKADKSIQSRFDTLKDTSQRKDTTYSSAKTVKHVLKIVKKLYF